MFPLHIHMYVSFIQNCITFHNFILPLQHVKLTSVCMCSVLCTSKREVCLPISNWPVQCKYDGYDAKHHMLVYTKGLIRMDSYLSWLTCFRQTQPTTVVSYDNLLPHTMNTSKANACKSVNLCITSISSGIPVQCNLSITTTSIMKFITCDLFSNVF